MNCLLFRCLFKCFFYIQEKIKLGSRFKFNSWTQVSLTSIWTGVPFITIKQRSTNCYMPISNIRTIPSPDDTTDDREEHDSNQSSSSQQVNLQIELQYIIQQPTCFCSHHQGPHKLVAIWLVFCCLLRDPNESSAEMKLHTLIWDDPLNLSPPPPPPRLVHNSSAQRIICPRDAI